MLYNDYKEEFNIIVENGENNDESEGKSQICYSFSE